MKKAMLIFAVVIIVNVTGCSASSLSEPTKSPLIGKRVTLVCVDYCLNERVVNLRSSTGRSSVVLTVPEGTEAVVLSSRTGEGNQDLIFFQVSVNGTEGWVLESEIKPQ